MNSTKGDNTPTNTLEEVKEAVKDGLSNHSGEFANPWIFKGSYSHELLADILNDIMNSERLFKNLEKLIADKVAQAVNKAEIKAQIRVLKHMVAQDRYTNRDSYAQKIISDLQEELETPNQVEGEKGKIYPVCNDCMKKHSYICPHVETPEECKKEDV